MSENAIRKHYDKLTMRERFAALVAAAIRDDESEARALADSAPRLQYTASDTHGLSHTFTVQALGYAVNQWELAYKVMVLLLAKESPDDPGADNALGLAAYAFVTWADAWRQFCAGYGIDGAALVDKLTCNTGNGPFSLAGVEKLLRPFAFTCEQAAEAIQAQDPTAKPLAVDGLVQSWHGAIEGS
jgi:hypothetical protein